MCNGSVNALAVGGTGFGYTFNWNNGAGSNASFNGLCAGVNHLQIHDHSPRFWKLVESRCPGYREQVRWLRRNSATLVL